MKVYISPTASQVKDSNGVGRVILAQHKYLPDLGIELVSDPRDADIINAHITDKGLDRPADCLSIHGLYWTGDKSSGHYAAWHHTANQQIIAAARRATELTVPSAWVAECFKRDMRRVPYIIGHGIDLAEWQPADHKGYILWNKNRNTDVCDPTPALELARRGYEVVSTFAPIGVRDVPSTFHVVGQVDHATMKELIRHAELYLATTKETFGIGTLESLACGVPVIGYDWGGTADIFRDSEANCLVTPGDTVALAAMVERILPHRYIYSSDAWLLARDYSWSNVMQQYAEVYRIALHKKEQHKNPKVSIIITNYNYDKYVSQAIQSAIDQTLEPEIIVVDDGSTDNSDIILGNYENDPDVTVIYQDNQGVAAARNNGIAASHGDFIICLDADDKLHYEYCEALWSEMYRNPDLGIAYTGLALLAEDGTLSKNDWPGPFSWEAQSTPHNPPSNGIPCAAMFRRDMWLRAGGYKQVYAPAEDAEFWTRGLSIGYLAKQVTTDALFHYRNHVNGASKTKQYKSIDTWHPWMRDKLYPMAAPANKMPLVKSYSDPLISVIIPVGPGHAQYLPAALDSLLGQTFCDWECIVVDDSMGDVDTSFNFEPYPFITWIITHGRGAGAARNAGLTKAKAPLVLFLDADDWLDPTALEKMLAAYLTSNGKYVYSDWFGVDHDGVQIQQTPDYTRMGWLENGMHAVTALIETDWARHVGGFDETLTGWEDWDWFIKLTIAGVCGVRIAEPLLYYRRYSGTWRRLALDNKDAKRNELLRDRYGDYVTGAKSMSPCCGGNGDTLNKVKQAMTGDNDPTPVDALVIDGQVRLEFIGLQTGSVTFYGQASRRTYRGGNNPIDRFINADEADVAHLVGSGKWQVVRQVQQETNTTPGEVLGLGLGDLLVQAANASTEAIGELAIKIANTALEGPLGDRIRAARLAEDEPLTHSQDAMRFSFPPEKLQAKDGDRFSNTPTQRPPMPEDLPEFKDDPVVDHITRDNAHTVNFAIDSGADDPVTTFVQTDGDGFPVIPEPRKRGRPAKQ